MIVAFVLIAPRRTNFMRQGVQRRRQQGSHFCQETAKAFDSVTRQRSKKRNIKGSSWTPVFSSRSRILAGAAMRLALLVAAGAMPLPLSRAS
jgi:hypothetical protein